MIDPSDPRLALDAWVLYDPPHVAAARVQPKLPGSPPLPAPQDGRISSLHALPAYVHVRFGGSSTGQACKPEDLRWPF